MNHTSGIEHRAVSRLEAGAPVAAIVPRTIDETFRLAQLIFQSRLAPYQLKTAEAVTVVLLKGLEIGLPPMAALECIGVINGKACLHSDGIPTLLWARGFKIKEWYENEDDLDKCVAHCVITRPEGDEYAFKYSAQDAKDNRLWDTREKVQRKDKDGNWYEADNDSPWYRYKKRMLKMRCRGWHARDTASDVLRGIPIFEEQRDIELSRGEYREIEGASALPDIPDIPDEAPAEPESDEPDRIADEDGYLANLEEELQAARHDPALQQEIWTENAHMAERLSFEGQLRMSKLEPLREAAE